jgi:hypothetical protein
MFWGKLLEFWDIWVKSLIFNLFILEKYDEAKKICLEALKIYKKRLIKEDLRFADIYFIQAEIYLFAKEYD